MDPVDLAQQLIRIDTTNPPGNEAAAIELVASVLRDAGIDPTIVEHALKLYDNQLEAFAKAI